MSTLHKDIKICMNREEELVNVGWAMTPSEQCAHANVLKAATYWFAFEAQRPLAAQEFLTAECVAEDLLRGRSASF